MDTSVIVDSIYLGCFALKFLVFDKAQVRKAALGKVPEQIILSEVRKMVEEMQALNKKLEETVSFSNLV